jgi:hypothetical protein
MFRPVRLLINYRMFMFFSVSEDAEIEPRTVVMISLAISGLSNRLDLIQLYLMHAKACIWQRPSVTK